MGGPLGSSQSTIPVVITIGDRRLTATFNDSATAQDLLTRLPLTVTMLDLYGHELVYRFDEPLATSDLTTAAPRRGDIVWSPRNALAIFYGDGDEAFSELQPLGTVTAGIDQIDQPGDSAVTFARAED